MREEALCARKKVRNGRYVAESICNHKVEGHKTVGCWALDPHSVVCDAGLHALPCQVVRSPSEVHLRALAEHCRRYAELRMLEYSCYRCRGLSVFAVLTDGVDVDAVAEELGGGCGYNVVQPVAVLCVGGSNRRVVADLRLNSRVVHT